MIYFGRFSYSSWGHVNLQRGYLERNYYNILVLYNIILYYYTIINPTQIPHSLLVDNFHLDARSNNIYLIDTLTMKERKRTRPSGNNNNNNNNYTLNL